MDLKKWSMGIFLRKNRSGRNPKLSLGSPPDADPGDRMLPGFGVDHG